MNAQVLTAPPAIIEGYNSIMYQRGSNQNNGNKGLNNVPNGEYVRITLKSSESVTFGSYINNVNFYAPKSNVCEKVSDQLKSIKDSTVIIPNSVYLKAGNLTTGTAYGIINNYGGIYKLGETLGRRENMKGAISVKKYLRVNKLYKYSIRSLAAILSVLVLLAVWSPLFFPREAAIVSMFLIIVGLIGLYIDRIGWRKKYRCS